MGLVDQELVDGDAAELVWVACAEEVGSGYGVEVGAAHAVFPAVLFGEVAVGFNWF